MHAKLLKKLIPTILLLSAIPVLGVVQDYFPAEQEQANKKKGEAR